MASISVRSMPRPWAKATSDGQLGAVVVRQRHGVELDAQPRRLSRIEPGQHLRQVAAAGGAAEGVRVQRVEADVHPPHARAGQRLGELGQARAVGGQGQLVQRAGAQVAAEGAEQLDHVAPHQGLAAGQPQLARAQADEQREHSRSSSSRLSTSGLGRKRMCWGMQ